MRSASESEHKALRPVFGVPLLERNILHILRSGFREIVVAVSQREPAIAGYLDGRGRALVEAVGGSIEIVTEPHPLGTIGAARKVAELGENVLVVNVDNLTTLELDRFVAHHVAVAAAMTVAVHVQEFQIPFGQVVASDGLITQYLEKSKVPVSISSGTYVLTDATCRRIARDLPTDIPELVAELRERGAKVAAFEHDSPWIDVNSPADLERAHALVRREETAFECWPRTPDLECVDVVVEVDGCVLSERRSARCSRYRERWDLPFEWLDRPGPASHEAIARRVHDRCGRNGARLSPLAKFDDLDPEIGKLARHHVYCARAESRTSVRPTSYETNWIPLDRATNHRECSPVLIRSMAILREAGIAREGSPVVVSPSHQHRQDPQRK